MSVRDFFRQRAEAKRFGALPKAARELVFYAEDGGAWPHLGPIVSELLRRGHQLSYLTSSSDDPVLTRNEQGLHAFWIGSGIARTSIFVQLDARVCVMTMPDLECSFIKRSKLRPVQYAYVFHSIVSAHMIYRKVAFDHYDTDLCVGPHHVEEIRAAEQRYGLPAKELVQHGYGRLDTILAEGVAGDTDRAPGSTRVLIAPSWGPTCIVESLGEPLVRALVEAGFDVTLRPHPTTSERFPGAVEQVVAAMAGHDNFQLDTDMASSASLHASDVMVSDWSGAALEYAFGRERPVIFVDVPRKVNNEDYGELGIEPLEVSVREELGAVVSPDRLEDLPAAVERLVADPQAMRARIVAAREQHVFHVGRSAVAGADAIEAMLGAAVDG